MRRLILKLTYEISIAIIAAIIVDSLKHLL
jgi:hypothetical protein